MPRIFHPPKQSKNLTHGHSLRNGKPSPEYVSWQHMRSRCEDKSHVHYKNYGGRGIAVCARWAIFENFLADMAERPSPNHSIDRRDCDKGYSPNNCYWATKKEQSRNRRNNHKITFRDETLCLTEWAERTGLKLITLSKRIQAGWTPERALTTPVR